MDICSSRRFLDHGQKGGGGGGGGGGEQMKLRYLKNKCSDGLGAVCGSRSGLKHRKPLDSCVRVLVTIHSWTSTFGSLCRWHLPAKDLKTLFLHG
ncbi:hypothetical protein OJAV_G00179840 [Oryzias javanicus]|uniref:Uncharacterized protein n=1 Tax=Oryzias javanicus TaxID=123683 RepID=A0A437CC50_ORYJA|nr:hypothetical protein OJAV_G00179840 [Oryzias javanicus]